MACSNKEQMRVLRKGYLKRSGPGATHSTTPAGSLKGRGEAVVAERPLCGKNHPQEL